MEVCTMIEFKKILFPCDFTDASKKIVPYVLSTAEKYGAQLYVFHAVDDLEGWGGVYMPYSHREDIIRQAMEQAEKLMDDICKEQLDAYPNLVKRLVSGNPAEQILQTVQNEGIDMIIIGTHGRGGLEHFIFGSVAEKVVKQAPVPVMVINPDKVG